MLPLLVKCVSSKNKMFVLLSTMNSFSSCVFALQILNLITLVIAYFLAMSIDMRFIKVLIQSLGIFIIYFSSFMSLEDEIGADIVG